MLRKDYRYKENIETKQPVNALVYIIKKKTSLRSITGGSWMIKTLFSVVKDSKEIL